MRILVIGKEGRLEAHTDPEVYAGHTFTYVPLGTPDEEILAAESSAEVIVVDAIGSVSRKLIEGMPNLKMIHSEGVGYQGVDVQAASEHGVYVCNCKGMNATAVAEQAVLLMLGCVKHVIHDDRAFREGKQIQTKEAYFMTGLGELADCQVGIIGLGDIGKATARLLNAFGCKVVYNSRSRRSEEQERELGVTYLSMDELLKTSDIVSLHVAVTPETIHMADDAFFGRMKKGAYLINTSRGELVGTEALGRAIASGKIAGAGLDCVEGEPVSKDNAIFRLGDAVLDKIVFSCHIGGITTSSMKRGYAMLWDDIGRLEKGQKPGHICNKEVQDK
ncbi:MAG: 2-hydroxyacid dehydrogenase [Lachnospiraceae bacterium]|jgi:phosphoglycerate dehydrogenase-like enzyme